MNISKWIYRAMPHASALLIFVGTVIYFFKPVFVENKSLAQHDIRQWVASAKFLNDYRVETGEEGLWANSIFGGMPAYLVNITWDNGIIAAVKHILGFGLPHPLGNIYWSFLSYYILLLVFGIRPWLAISGALAFGLSSYMIIGIGAGHNSRIGAIAYIPMVLAGVHMVFTYRWRLGLATTVCGLMLHLRENHLQMTYYLSIILFAYGMMQLVLALRNGKIMVFSKRVALLLPAVIIAIGSFFGLLWALAEYSTYSIRGPSELLSEEGNTSSGLEKSYAFLYSNGIAEPMTLLIPNFLGGATSNFFIQDRQSNTYNALVADSDPNRWVRHTSSYWGNQPNTSPYYAGAFFSFLFVLGVMFAERKYKWWLISIAVLGIMLSWGSNFSTLNYFLFDYLPGYNKFRSVTFALAMTFFAIPLLGMLGIQGFLNATWERKNLYKVGLAFALTGGVCLLLLLLANILSLSKETDIQLPQTIQMALQSDRATLLRQDAFRSLTFIIIVTLLLLIYHRQKINYLIFCLLLIAMTFADMIPIDKRYLNEDNYSRHNYNQIIPTEADKAILKDTSYYRVYGIHTPWSQEGSAAYFHNIIGGYNGAKMRRFQDLYDSCLSQETHRFITDIRGGVLDFSRYNVINMLNVKYIIFGKGANDFIINPSANGHAWFADTLVKVSSPNAELQNLRHLYTKRQAIIDTSQFTLQNPIIYDSSSTISLQSFKPSHMTYSYQSTTNNLAVFSEIFYPKGWHAFINDKEVPILRVNYVLRGIEIPKGQGIITFKFEPKPYVIGNKVMQASSWGGFGMALILIVWGIIRGEHIVVVSSQKE